MTGASRAAALEAALRDRGVLPAGAPPLPPPEPARPWFLGALLGVSGWLAGLLTLGFIVIAFHPDRVASLVAFGLLLLGAAYGLYRLAEGAFAEQLALAVAVAGHTSFAAGVHDALRSDAGTAAAVAVTQAAWVLVAPNALARLLSTVAGCAAAALCARLLVAPDHGAWRREGLSLPAALLAWAAAWGPVAAAAQRFVATEARWMAAGRQALARPVLTGLLVALALATPISHPPQTFELWGAGAAQRTSWVALWPLLSAAATVAALWLGHRLRSRALMGTAIGAALLHAFHFYLALGMSLRVKSAVMVAVGALLLGARAALDHLGRRAPP